MAFSDRNDRGWRDRVAYFSCLTVILLICGGGACVRGKASGLTVVLAVQWALWLLLVCFSQFKYSVWLLALELAETFLLVLGYSSLDGARDCLELFGGVLSIAIQAIVSQRSLQAEFVLSKHYLLWSGAAFCTGKELNLSYVSALLCTLFAAKFRFEQRCEYCTETTHKGSIFTENYHEAVIELAENGAVLSCNKAAKSLLKCDVTTSQQLLKKLEFTPNSEAQPKHFWADITTFLRSDQHSQLLGTTPHPPLFLQWHICRSPSNRTSYLSASDITALIQAQCALQLEQSYKRTLADSISHELRTPTNAIVNLTRDISDKYRHLPHSLVRDLELTHISGQLLLGMVDTIRDLSTVLTGKLLLNHSSFDLCAELKAVCALFQPQCTAKAITLSVNLDPYLPPLLVADKDRLREVILILLGNAVKYTDRGGVKVVAGLDIKGRVVIEVRDTGVRLDYEKAKELMSVRGYCSGSQARKAGLGLWIANCIAESLGGKGITVKECVGGGASFSFRMTVNIDPVAMVTQLIGAESAYDVPEEIEGPLYLPKSRSSENDLSYLQPCPEVLIVDDNSFNRLILAHLLASFSLSSIQAENGLEALSLIRKAANSNKFCKLILMDLDMPVMDGFTAAKAIEGMKAKGELPGSMTIVACSAYSPERYKHACEEVGMRTYIEKPVSRDRVHQLVRTLGLLKL